MADLYDENNEDVAVAPPTEENLHLRNVLHVRRHK